MDGAEKSIFIVAKGDGFVGTRACPPGALPCFGDVQGAREFIRQCAEQMGVPESLYRIVEYGFTGRVLEG